MFELNGLMVTVHAQEILEALERAADHFSDGFARFLLFANTSRTTNIQSNFVESWLQFGIKDRSIQAESESWDQNILLRRSDLV